MNDQDIAKRYVNKINACGGTKTAFTLTFAEFKRLVTSKKCKYTGIALTTQQGKAQISTDVTIDRVNNSIGYVTGNVVACCFAYNTFKSIL